MAQTLDRVFIMVTFYSDAELMLKLWQVTGTFKSCLKLRDGPFSFHYKEKNAFTKLWLFTVPPKLGYAMAPTLGLLQYKEIQLYKTWRLRS